jgi:hypothetical protein
MAGIMLNRSVSVILLLVLCLAGSAMSQSLTPAQEAFNKRLCLSDGAGAESQSEDGSTVI